jgi:hypothetical protein
MTSYKCLAVSFMGVSSMTSYKCLVVSFMGVLSMTSYKCLDVSFTGVLSDVIRGGETTFPGPNKNGAVKKIHFCYFSSSWI